MAKDDTLVVKICAQPQLIFSMHVKIREAVGHEKNDEGIQWA